MQGKDRQQDEQDKTADASQMTMHIWEMIRSSGRKIATAQQTKL
jgi:hypothetical protein